MVDSHLVVIFEYPVSSSGVKNLGLIRVGYTCQWRCFLRRYLVEGIARIWLDLFFKVKPWNLASGDWIWWGWQLSVVPLLKALLLKNIIISVVSKDGWCGYCCRSSLPIAIFFALFSRLGITLVLRDTLCRRVYFFFVCVGIGCVQLT